jgi:hypothetical protein
MTHLFRCVCVAGALTAGVAMTVPGEARADDEPAQGIAFLGAGYEHPGFFGILHALAYTWGDGVFNPDNLTMYFRVDVQLHRLLMEGPELDIGQAQKVHSVRWGLTPIGKGPLALGAGGNFEFYSVGFENEEGNPGQDTLGYVGLEAIVAFRPAEKLGAVFTVTKQWRGEGLERIAYEGDVLVFAVPWKKAHLAVHANAGHATFDWEGQEQSGWFGSVYVGVGR